MFSMAMWMAAIVAPLQVYVGDLHGLNTLKYQPAKVAAMEGHYETYKGAPLILFGFPDDEAEKSWFTVEISKLGSKILTHHWDGEVKGLKEWDREDRPPAEVVFWSFRVMVGLGMAMMLIGLWSVFCRIRGGITSDRWLLRISVLMGPSGFIAVLAGWITTEVGRQPWTIHGLLRTADSASPLSAGSVGATLIAFIVVYFTLFGIGTYYILRLMGASPDGDAEPEEQGVTRAAGITPAMALNTHGTED